MKDSNELPLHQDEDTPVAIVTGASRGTGRAIARALLGRGFRVAFVARNEERLRGLQGELDPDGERSLVLPADIRDAGAVGEAVEAVTARWQRIDVLVNNAAAGAGDAPDEGELPEWGSRPSVASYPEEAWDLQLGSNLKGAYLFSKAVIPAMEVSGAGHIVMISSLAARLFDKGDACFSATKAGLEAFARKLGDEVAEKGIQVNVVVPGAIDTSAEAGASSRGAGEARGGDGVPATEIAELVADLVRPHTNTWAQEVVVVPMRRPAAEPGDDPKVAVVTRVHSILGRISAEHFLRAGYRVAGVDTGKHSGMPEVERLADLGASSFMFLPCDMSGEEEIRGALDLVRDAWGQVDLLFVNAAASSPVRTMERATERDWLKVMQTGVRGAYLFAKEVLPGMRERGRGHVFMASHHPGHERDPSQPLSALGRLGISGLASLFAEEAADAGVAFTDLVLGAVGKSAHEVSEDRRRYGERSCAIPAGEVARVIREAAERGPETHVRKIVLTGLRSKREQPSSTEGAGDERRGDAETRIAGRRHHEAVQQGDLPWKFAGEAYSSLLTPYFYLDVGSACDLRCDWCSVDKRDACYRPVEDLSETARLAAEHKLGRAVFIGGEPSLYTGLEEVMLNARAAGIRDFGMMTNGSGLTDRAQVERLSELGMSFWQLSWADHRPDVLEAHYPGQRRWETLHAALEHICGIEGNRVVLYQVILPRSIEHLSDAVAFFSELRERHPQIEYVAHALLKTPVDIEAGLQHTYDYRDAVPQISAAIELAEARGLPYLVHHLPGCLLPSRPEQHSAFPGADSYDTRTRAWSAQPVTRSAKAEACLRCRLFEHCEGPRESYLEIFGGDAFTPTGDLLRPEPLPAEALAAASPDTLAEAAAEPSHEAPSPDAPGSAPGEAADLPAAQSAATEAEDESLEAAAATLTELVTAALHPAISVSGGKITSLDGEPGFECRIAGPKEGLSSRIFIKAARSGERGFLRTERLVLMHAGSSIDPIHARVLKALISRLGQTEAQVLRLLTFG